MPPEKLVLYPNGLLAFETGIYEMVKIPAGEFLMGDANAGPVHRVQIASFLLGRTEVTFGLWKEIMGAQHPDCTIFEEKKDEDPVERISWDDCQSFIEGLNSYTKSNFRLPTEAEWEYACRAGTTGERYGEIDAIAWYKGNSRGSTHAVGLKQPNAWGLYDMLGNVDEWCQDWYDEGYYARSSLHNPPGPDPGSERVCRGGSWDSAAHCVRNAYRFGSNPSHLSKSLGFRLAADAKNRL